MYKNEKSIWKNWAVINLWELNWVTISDVYFLSLQTDIIMLILNCKYINMINETDFFYQWQIAVKNCEKFIIVSHYDLKTVSVAFMNYQEFLLYVQHMMNMIFHSHKFFVCCYIDDIVIFSKILEDHFWHLNMIFSLFNRLEIIFKKIKTYLNYLSIILLDQWMNDFNMITSQK